MPKRSGSGDRKSSVADHIAMRPLTSTSPATERARLRPGKQMIYPSLLPGAWYDVVPGSADAIGGLFLVDGRQERYVRAEAFLVVPVAEDGPGS